MGAPDSPPDFLPTHLVLWVTPWPVSLAPMGFIYDNGNDFMSQHLVPPASLPDTAPSQIVSFGGYPFRPPVCPVGEAFSARLFYSRSGGCFMRPCGHCIPVPQDTPYVGPPHPDPEENISRLHLCHGVWLEISHPLLSLIGGGGISVVFVTW